MKTLTAWLVIIFAFIISGFTSKAYGQDEVETEAEICSRLMRSASIPKALQSLLGAPQSCVREDYTAEEWGVYQTVVLRWPEAQLTVKYRPPETGIYIIKALSETGLSAKWFDTLRDAVIDSGFNLNWDVDRFPGPTAEHYEARDDGTNAQVWIERNSSHDITWLRFSYAL